MTFLLSPRGQLWQLPFLPPFPLLSTAAARYISFTRTDRFPSSPRCFLDKRRTKQSQGFPSSPVCPAVSMREFQDLMDFFPYCLLVALPVFIALSPMPVHAVAVAAAASSSASAQDFPVHRYVT